MISPPHHQQWYQQPNITTKDEPSWDSREQSSPVFQRVRRAWLLRQRVSWAPDTGPEWSSPTRDDQATDSQVQVGLSRASSREAKLSMVKLTSMASMVRLLLKLMEGRLRNSWSSPSGGDGFVGLSAAHHWSSTRSHSQPLVPTAQPSQQQLQGL